MLRRLDLSARIVSELDSLWSHQKTKSGWIFGQPASLLMPGSQLQAGGNLNVYVNVVS